jgi:hypothetical protein
MDVDEQFAAAAGQNARGSELPRPFLPLIAGLLLLLIL